jgi:hypothetical protein
MLITEFHNDIFDDGNLVINEEITAKNIPERNKLWVK